MTDETKPDAYLSAHPEATPRLNTALAKAQGVMEAARKESENPAFKRDGKVSTYADLASVIEACRKPLADNGLAFIQTCRNDKDGVTVTTHLLHASGEERQSPFWVPVAAQTAHGFAAASTYARRLSLKSLLGVAEDDDDGNRASGKEPDAPTPEEIEAGKRKMEERAVREKTWAADVAKFAALGKTMADLSAKIGKRLDGPPGNDDWKKLLDWGKELKAARPSDPDEAARQAVIAASEKALAAPITFASCIDRMRLAKTEAECALIAAEFATTKPTKGDLAAMTRACVDRQRILADAKRALPPAPSDTSDVPF